jgi:DNA polymerase-4
VSVGVARTKHLAKIGSQVAKPDGLVVIPPDHELEFLGPLPVGLVWGVGEVTRERLHANGIRTIGELAATDPSVLQGLLGDAAGAKLGALATNADPRRVETSRPVHSVGAQSALGRATATPELVRETLAFLADRVAGRMRAKGRAGRTVTVRVRFRGMRSVTRSLTLAVPVATTLTLTEIAVELAWEGIGQEQEVTLLGVSVSNLVDQPGLQLEMEVGEEDRWRPGSATGAARWASDRSVDAIRAKFGKHAVGYAAVMLSDAGRVPDEFRELAQGGDRS